MIDIHTDHFATFGIPRCLEPDAKGLRLRFIELSRERHPDRHGDADVSLSEEVQRSSARVNDAFRVLGDPVARAEHLLDLSGVERPDGAAKCPPDLLMEIFTLREEMTEGDGSKAVEKARRLLAETEGAFAALRRGHDDEEGGAARQAILGEVRSVLDRRKFLANIVREVEESLG